MGRKLVFQVDPMAETEFECPTCRSKIRSLEEVIGAVLDDGIMVFYHEECTDESVTKRGENCRIL